MTNHTPENMIAIMMIITAILMVMNPKASQMALYLIVMISFTCATIDIFMSSLPMAQIIFLTMVGGMMIIFLYLVVTMYRHKLSSKTKSALKALMLYIPLVMLKVSRDILPLIGDNNMFSNNMIKMTITLIAFLTLILLVVIKLHSKSETPKKGSSNPKKPTKL